MSRARKKPEGNGHLRDQIVVASTRRTTAEDRPMNGPDAKGPDLIEDPSGSSPDSSAATRPKAKKRRSSAPSTLIVPRQMIEELASLRFPPRTDRRLQNLMDLNNEGALNKEGRQELRSLVDLSERMSLLKAQAMIALGWTPNAHR